MRSGYPRVTTVILNWRRPDDTLACFRSVTALNYPAIDIIICDNNSGDGSFEKIVTGVEVALENANHHRARRGLEILVIELISANGPRSRPMPEPGCGLVRVVQTGRNGGYAFGNNVGIAMALKDCGAEYVWVLNNDTKVDQNALASLVSKCEADPKIGLCGSLVLYMEQPDRVQTLGGGKFLPSRARCTQIGEGLRPVDAPPDNEVETQLDYINGAAVFARRLAIEAGGLMDEDYFLYYEEIDWAERIRSYGFRLGFCSQAIVLHRVGATTETNDLEGHSPSAVYYMERSKFRFLWRKHRVAFVIALPILAKSLLELLIRRDLKRAHSKLRGFLDWRSSGK